MDFMIKCEECDQATQYVSSQASLVSFSDSGTLLVAALLASNLFCILIKWFVYIIHAVMLV